MDARLGDAVRLERALAEPSVRLDNGAPAGAALRITLVWRATRSPGADFTVFRHVLDAEGRTIAQLDGPPALGDAPTSDWHAGDRVVDTVTVALPSLRDRTGDIPLLAKSFLERFRAKHGREVETIDPEAYRRLLSYGWPGNIRELEHAIERAVLVARGREITLADLPGLVLDRHDPAT